MVLKRIMPCLLLDGEGLVKTTMFRDPRYVGDPINAIRIFNEKEVDELVLLDIRASRTGSRPRFELINECASECFMPFAYGGGISSMNDFSTLFRLGVEKAVVNTACIRKPEIVRQAVREYGSSSIVGSVDYRKSITGRQKVHSASGRAPRRNVVEHSRYLAEEMGVGEILLQCVDRDGTWSGYDLAIIREVATTVSIPVIACGGAGSVAHVREVLHGTPANAAAIGSMAVFQRRGGGVLINFPERHQVIDRHEEPAPR